MCGRDDLDRVTRDSFFAAATQLSSDESSCTGEMERSCHVAALRTFVGEFLTNADVPQRRVILTF